ncbi:hypothetical protein [Sphingomonas sp.]|uniref:hypothetical protein n=1 Tax=Sphingomonas sp. TaxID=28214 RepID=UPI001B11EFF5|nr:hypothetical protein [Sphingomonas sp.]MBO9714670.1 hypothetical protein [Sphingomonas sp.]
MGGNEAKRLLPFKIVVGVLALVLLYGLLGSPRYWVLHDQPVVAHMRAIKVPSELGDLTGEILAGGVQVRNRTSKAEQFLRVFRAAHGQTVAPASFANMTAPAVGYSIREIGFFGMPFGWYREYGDVVYVRNDWGTIYGPLEPPAMAAVNKANGGDVTQGNLFPFWNHCWGWLWVAGLGLALWLWHRAQVKRREELGLID